MALAHSRNSRGEKHDLATHLIDVAKLAAEFAAKFGASDLAYWAGLWHDLGKFHPAFQAYLANPVTARGPDHKGAGAVLASRYAEPLAFLVAGHHGGLQDREALKAWLREKARDPRTEEALSVAHGELPSIEPASRLPFPAWPKTEIEFFLRMLFSALADADFLDTERHFDPERSERRASADKLADLWTRLEKSQAVLTGKQTDRVNLIRHEVYEACLTAARLPPGFFRLTVPTGGGKTRSSLAFALGQVPIFL
jgi:CRISPR-associated endonuclease/helicase Cas3